VIQLSALALLLFLATGFAVLSAGMGWRHRDAPGSVPFVALMALVAYWSLTYGIQLLGPTLGHQLFWDNVQYAGGFLAPTAFFVFTLYYTGREDRLTRGRLTALLALPVVAAAAVWVPGASRLIRQDATLVAVDSLTVASITHGPLFLLTVAYSYVLVTVGLGLLVVTTLRTPRLYRRQTLLITVGAAVPIAGSVGSYLLDLTVVDLTPLALSVFGVTFVVALARFRLLDVLPVARDRVIGQVDDGILVADEQGRIVDVNEAATAILDTEDLIGRSLSAVAAEHADALTGATVDSPADLVREDGRHFECRKATLTDADGAVQAHRYILHEVTERRTREQWLRSLTEHASDVICVLDEDLTVSYVSPSIERVLGYEPAAFEGAALLDYVHEDATDSVRETLRTDADAPTQATFRIETAAGDWRTVQAKNKNRLDDPIVGGIVMNVRDVTESRARKRDLEAKNERLDAFASVVSHDLRNPLNVAQSRATFLEEELPSEHDGTDHLASMTNALDRMEAIIENTLTLAKQGETVAETERVALAATARRCWDMVDTEAATLTVADDILLRADPDRLEHVFENLFRNCIDHGDPGVAVRVGPLTDGFYVEDDGPGIPPDERETVFEAGHTSATDGTGFGLTIVQRIVQAHGWTVSITDAEHDDADAGDQSTAPEADGAAGARFEIRGVDVPDPGHEDARSDRRGASSE
jgi:PAS domain S-box-containing protein